MTKKLKISLCILFVITVLSTWAFFVSTKMTRSIKNVADTETISDEDAKAQDMVLTESRDGKKFWELYAVSANYDSALNQVHLTNVKGNFYKNDKVVLSFDSPVATYYDKTKEIKLSGGSRAATSNNILITSEELRWKSKDDEIIAKGNVKIQKSSDILATGDKSIFFTKSSKIKIIGRVNTRLLKNN